MFVGVFFLNTVYYQSCHELKSQMQSQMHSVLFNANHISHSWVLGAVAVKNEEEAKIGKEAAGQNYNFDILIDAIFVSNAEQSHQGNMQKIAESATATMQMQWSL